MTDTEVNIAIAEACGWQIHPKDRFIVIPPNSPHSVQPLSTIPSYTTDLNAMRSAVCSKTAEFQDEFDSFLKNSGKHVAAMTALEWAKIFLLCLQSQRARGN